MRKHDFPRQALISLLTATCFIFAIAIPFAIPVAAEAATSTGSASTASGLAQAAIQNINTQLQSGQSIDSATLAYTTYVLALAGQNVSTLQYVYNGTSSLQNLLVTSATNIIRDPNAATDSAVYSAKLIAYESLALNKLGENTLANQLASILEQRQITSGSAMGSFDDNPFSDLPALAALGAAGELSVTNQVYALGYVRGTQNTNGSWGGYYSKGTYYSYPDFLSTAWAIEALSDLPGAAGNQQIQTAINNGLAWMQQQESVDGSVYCKNGMDDPVVDTAQTIITMEALGYNPADWGTSQGNNPVTYMLSDALNSDGSFGTSKNLMDAAWALEAYLLLANSGSTGGTTGGGTASSPSGTSTVSLAVVGETGGLLDGPGTVTVSSSDKWGETVLGALDASGQPYTMSTAYQGFVESIDGEANSGMSGWMYEVNGKVESVAASQEPISSGDRIIWWYSTSGMNSTAPNWNDLLTSASAAGTTGETQSQNNNSAVNNLPVTSLPPALQPSSSDLTALQALARSAAGRQDLMGAPDKFVAVTGAGNPMGVPQLAALGKELSNNTVNLSQMVQASSGATLTDSNNQLALYIPPGALSSNTDITAGNNQGNQANIPSSGVPDIQEISPVYDLGPTGTTFSTPVTLILKVAVPPLVKPQNVCLAWYDGASGKWVMIPSVVDVANGLIAAQIAHFSKYALFARIPEKSFADVTSSFNWAKNDIETLAGGGIVKGVDGTHFEPSLPVTRAQLATILVRALGIKETAATCPFKDVNHGDWYAQAVSAAYAEGLVSGFPDGNFYPNEPVTREEMAVILARSLNLRPPAKGGQELTFTDGGQISPWARSSVSAAVADGLIKGLPNGTFAPKAPLDRAEAAVLVYRVLMLNW